MIGFEHVWENKGTFSKRTLIKAVKGKLLERFNFFFKKKVQVGKDQEKAQSEKDSHSKNQGGKKPN